MDRVNVFYEKIQHIFSTKRMRITLYIVAILWLSVITQIIVNKVYFRDLQIAEAFVKTNTEDLECSIELVAQHPTDFLSETDKKDIIHHIADSIGLKIDKDIEIIRESDRTEYVYQKQAKKAFSSIKIASLKQEADSAVTMKHFIVTRLKIKDYVKSADKYRKLLESAYKELKLKENQLTVQYEGSVRGSMPVEDKEDMARLLVKELQGEVAFDYQQGDSYTLYAYTGLIDEYIESAGCKINIQIAITYDEETDKTRIYLATPIINQDW